VFGFLRQRRAVKQAVLGGGPELRSVSEVAGPSAAAANEEPAPADPSPAEDALATLLAIERSHAVVSFSRTGLVLAANPVFLRVLGYEAHEVLGRPHSMFLDPTEARSAAYAAFWRELRGGSAQARRFRRLGKGGREVWLEATYTPVLDAGGGVIRVVKVATDISAHELMRARLSAGAARVNRAASSFAEMAREVQRESGRTIEHAAQAAQEAADVVSIARQLEGEAATLSRTVDAISVSADTAANVAVQAVQSALLTSHAVVELGKRSDEIGDVVSTVAEVARLTNLLALNATIEAARAGETGLGFAVVANAVKDLSKQTAASAEDISRRIGAMQSTTLAVATAIRAICDVIGEVAAHQRSIAAAVDQQLALTASVAQAATCNAGAGRRIADSLAKAREAASGTAQLGERALDSARSLAVLASAMERANTRG
jgi:methyl-accepting chemotaxis protein